MDKDMEKILKKEAIGDTIVRMAEIADSKRARLSVEIESENGQLRMKAMLWGNDYTILGRAEYLACSAALEPEAALEVLLNDIKEREAE